jgi:nicotinamide-nucleotide amidase
MNAILISIGDELVLGQTIDTNSAWLSQQLAAIGCGVLEHITIPDDQSQIERAITNSISRCQIILITGGLGPTADDLTRQAIAAALGTPLVLNEPWLDNMKQFFARRKRPMPQTNSIQAMIPTGARIIWNNHGTAAGIDADPVSPLFPSPSASFGTMGEGEGLSSVPQKPATSQPCRLFAVPGVPKEMKGMFADYILPILRPLSSGAVILSSTLHTYSLGESAIAELLGDLMDRTRNPSVGTTVSGGVVSLRINARFSTLQEAQRQLAATVEQCRHRLRSLIYGQDDQTLASVVADLLLHPPTHFGPGPLIVATAESCTGGLLAKMLTDIPGSSAYFHQGWITYSNDAKIKMLSVDSQLLAAHGAVSEPVVAAMAQSARQNAAAHFALAISGIAGPTGGTPEKPVGTVCIALASGTSTEASTHLFPGDREVIRDRSAKTALNLLRLQLLKLH